MQWQNVRFFYIRDQILCADKYLMTYCWCFLISALLLKEPSVKLPIHTEMQAQRLPESVTDCLCPLVHGLCWAVSLLEPASGDVSVGGSGLSWDAEIIPCHQKKSVFIEVLLRSETGT